MASLHHSILNVLYLRMSCAIGTTRRVFLPLLTVPKAALHDVIRFGWMKSFVWIQGEDVMSLTKPSLYSVKGGR